MRTIQRIVTSVRDDISDLVTRRAMPTNEVTMVDPFLFLNHHGPQVYKPLNNGLPFGPHPHRGFETVTFILEGDISHRDSGGHESVIKAGGVQWMTAGRGLIHEEISSDEFKKSGGPLEILQLWVNLPATLKMTNPSYTGLQKDEIIKIFDDECLIELISGQYKNHNGSFNTLTQITSMIVTVNKDKRPVFKISKNQNIFFYVISGKLTVNGNIIVKFQTALFENDHEDIFIQAEEDSKILLCHARPYEEPVVSYGPFVMNSKKEIAEAIADYQAGKFV